MSLSFDRILTGIQDVDSIKANPLTVLQKKMPPSAGQKDTNHALPADRSYGAQPTKQPYKLRKTRVNLLMSGHTTIPMELEDP
jgi:hypothetical protein